MDVAVVLATYNGEQYIVDQLNSIINQTRIPDNIIISDDHSTDSTIALCDTVLKEAGCNYSIVQSKGKGVIDNFYNGLSFVKQDIVFFADQDDVWDNKKIEKMLKCFEDNPKCMEVLCDCYIWDGINKPTITMRQLYGDNFPVITNFLFEKESFWKIMLDRNIATGMCMAFRKSILDMYYYKPQYVLHDSAISIIAASLGDVMYIVEPLAYYRQHENNAVGVKKRFNFKTLKNMRTHTYRVIELESERSRMISDLNAMYNFLSPDNSTELEKLIQFSNVRKKCIYNNKLCELIRLIRKNLNRYPSVIFALRDVIVCMIGRID